MFWSLLLVLVGCSKGGDCPPGTEWYVDVCVGTSGGGSYDYSGDDGGSGDTGDTGGDTGDTGGDTGDTGGDTGGV